MSQLPNATKVLLPGADHAIRKIAMLGNHTPRQCGIATFTADLSDAIRHEFPRLDTFVLAMNDAGSNHAYPAKVRYAIDEADEPSYRRAAAFLAGEHADVLSVQHEYGIYGPRAGAHLLALLHSTQLPVVSTLHTVLRHPNAEQRAVMDELTHRSDRLVVMSPRGASLLHEVHGVPLAKIDVIPHGIPHVPVDPTAKERLGLAGKRVILTFGLISPDKGLEHAIDALPQVLARHPDTVYLVVGATHPHIRARVGEAYRTMLQQRAERLGVASQIVFHNRFVSAEELIDFLSAADVYVTPYLQDQQSTSGTLAYAVGAGKAVISTPYVYAQELLADGRGLLVPPRDAQALGDALCRVLGDPAVLAGLQEKAGAYGEHMGWPAVAQGYVETFERARAERPTRVRRQHRTGLALPDLDLAHVRRLTDDTGIIQHAVYAVPRYSEGYCLDDNARALRLVALADTDGALSDLTSRYLAFVAHAFDPAARCFRNFLSYDRRWLEPEGSEDSHGRALWALGSVVGRSRNAGHVGLARELFHATLPGAVRHTSPRAWAFTLLGIDEHLRAFPGESAPRNIRADLAHRLLGLFSAAKGPDWAWFEDRVTYANARLPQALIASGAALGDDAMIEVGLHSLAWLFALQTGPDGFFAPVGSNGFKERGQPGADWDQQPIEAGGMVSACVEALRATGDPRWATRAHQAFGWFLGDNALLLPVYDAQTGGCRDGLHADRANENQGAESTLAFLLALLELRSAAALPLDLEVVS